MRDRDRDRAFALKYFALYCEAKQYGFRDDMARLLGYIRELGFDVRAKGGVALLIAPEEYQQSEK